MTTLGALGATPDLQLIEWFEAGSARTWRRSRASRTSAASRPSGWRNRSRGRPTFDRDLRGSPSSVLRRLPPSCARTLAREERRGRTIGIKLRYADFTTLTEARTLDAAVNDHATVGGVAVELLRRLDPRRPVRLLGVRWPGLDEREPLRTSVPAGQMSLSL